ncbi:MAG: Mut7-C RNAse domain-containing protein [Pseudomonadota bacterium]
MKFACDAMLGRLARWLRISGHDVFYRADMDRAVFLRVAKEERRVVLTRAENFKELSEIPPYHIITGNDLDDHLSQVYKAFPQLKPFDEFLTRCVECNVLLVEIDKDKFSDSIPPKAQHLSGRFCRCPSCGKLLWPGSHVERIKARLTTLFPKANSNNQSPNSKPGFNN